MEVSPSEETMKNEVSAVGGQTAVSPVFSDQSTDKKHILGDPVMTFHPSMNRCATWRATSPEPSCVSVKSHQSMDPPLKLSEEAMSIHPRKGAASSDHSCVSMKSHQSMDPPLKFSEKAVTFNPNEAKNDQSSDLHQDSHEPVDDVLQRVKDRHKTIMKNKYESLFEGIKQRENQTLLKRIYTQLYIIEGESEGVNEEHEVLHMEKNTRTQHLQDTTIYCNDIFKPLPEPEYKTEKRRERKDKIKSVLTKGIAGIGKTVSVQKFILDWAEGTANQDVDFIFVLPFRELNLIQDDQYSLHKLLLDFHPELQDLDSKIYDECKVVFIFDGLDENRMTLMFSDAEKVSEVTETSSVPVLISNLMKGDLLPSALIWITSRPAAANQIPSKYINRLTEIQGFNDAQKEEYFRKRISDEHQASRIISHVKRSRSLHIMCHIPVFCWISSTVLQNILKQDNERAEIPKTLTEMYIHFLLIQMNMKNEKYDERDPEKLLQSNREVIVKLSELAFKQLMKGNVMFYEEELRESGIDITDASVYSGICTEIFKEESVIHQRKIYCFIHLSFQEFLAAFYVLFCHIVKDKSLFLYEEEDEYDSPEEISDFVSLIRGAVDEALKSKTGHLDLFLRFLLGISLESNKRLLQDQLTHMVDNIREVTQYIKDKIKGRNDDDDDDDGDDDLSADRSINLFLCLLEVNDQTLYREIEEFVRSDKHSEKKLSAAHCSAIAYMLQMSEEVLDELNLKKYNTTQEGRRRLIPAVTNCTKAVFTDWIITIESCKMLSSCLQSSNSPVRDLDLSNNNLQDSGVKLISDALKSPDCKLGILRLSGCNLTAECCESLSLCLQYSNSSVRDLDLSNNDLQDSGVKLISDALKSPNCKLEILRLSMCNLTAESCKVLASTLQSSNSSVRDLDVSNNDLQDSGVKLISDALKSPNCKLHTLRLSGCMVTDEGCCYLASALSSNPSSHLRELDLSYNYPQHSGHQMLSQRLNHLNLKYELNTNTHNGGEFRIKAGLHKYACDLTLDPSTAHKCLTLSEDNRKVTYVKDPQPYPDHPDRFEECIQVLCRETLTGRVYWEVEFSWRARISVTYKSISRKERSSECDLGFNVKSWSLYCSENRLIVCHDKSKIDIPAPSPPSNRVGVYLDWSAGTLSFYSVSDTQTLTHLHTINTTFTQPLYAGFRVYDFVLLC